MLILIFLAVISPYTTVLPAVYIAFKVFSEKLNIYKNPWNTGLLLLFIWSLFVGLLNHSALSTLAAFAFFLYFCVSVFLQNYLNNEDKIERFFKYLINFSIFSALLGLVEKVAFMYFDCTLWKAILGITSKATLSHRVYSTFGNPNVAGNWFAIMILICLYFSNKATKNNKLFYQLSSILFVVILCLTGSRGAYIGFLVGIFIYYLLKEDKRDTWFLILISIPIIILTFLPSQSSNINMITGHQLNRSFVTRDQIWEGCIKMISLKPIAGWGIMGVLQYGSKYINYYAPVYHAHNIWLNYLTVLGVVGLSIYLYMKVYLFKSLKLLYTNKYRLAPLMVAIQFLVLGHGFVDLTMMAPQTGLLFISCSALISSLSIQYSNSLANNAVDANSYQSLSKTG